MADLLNINMNAGEAVAALDEYGDFSAGMTATEFVEEVNTAFPDADAELTDTASELVGKVNNAQPSPSPAIPEGTVLKFLHYSDPHTKVGSTNKAVAMMANTSDADYDEDIDFTILSGDNDAYSGSLKSALIAADNTSKHLLIMGNHDASGYKDSEGNRSHPLYVAAVREFMANANVVWGGEGVCYWYKDFVPTGLPIGAKVRIFGIDEYENDGHLSAAYVTNTQIEWLIDKIDDLGKDDYFIIVTHQPPFKKGAETPAQTQHRNAFCWLHTWGWDVYNETMDIFSDIVKAYKGGELLNKTYLANEPTKTLSVYKDWRGKTNQATFLCFPCGHVHADFHAGVPKTNYKDLLVMCIDCSRNTGDGSDFAAQYRADNNYVIINKVTIDFCSKRIRIDRIGCKEVQAYGTEGEEGFIAGYKRKYIVFDYNANVIEEGVEQLDEEGGEE